MQAKATALFLLFATLACQRETAPQQVLNPLGKTYRTGDDVRAAQVVWRQQPDASRCTSTFSGVLIGEAVIDQSGLVRSVQLLRDSGDACVDDAAVRAMKEWRFRPAMKNEQPVSTVFTLTVSIQRP